LKIKQEITETEVDRKMAARKEGDTPVRMRIIGGCTVV
jgi:hypothetical protein